MITKELVAQAYKTGTIHLEECPCGDDETVAWIGSYWFYSGWPNTMVGPSLYKEQVSESAIVDELCDALEDIRTKYPAKYSYCESVLTGQTGLWTEVTCGDLIKENQCWPVMAREAKDDGCRVIAFINDITGAVMYADPRASGDRMAQEVISKKIGTLGPMLKVWRRGCDIRAELQTPYGTIIADFEPDKMTGSGYDAVYVGVRVSDDPECYFDTQSTRVENGDVKMYAWSDIFNEDWQDKVVITESDIRALIASENNTAEPALPDTLSFSLAELGYAPDAFPEGSAPPELADILSDCISDKSGFCHKGFRYEVSGGNVIASGIQWDTTE